MRFELTTPTLARLCSTTELRPLKDAYSQQDIALCEGRLMAQNFLQIKPKS